jgi:hypothetical protein
MFIVIAVAVGFFVANGIRMGKWSYLEKEPCVIDFATSNMVNERKLQYRSIYAILLTIGIVLCVVSFVPTILVDAGIAVMKGLGVIALFVLVAVGVFLIVLGSCTQGSFQRLLSLNDAGTVAGNYGKEQKDKYRSRTVAGIMSVYWPTVTCIYLSWSFLTFAWGMTWIIWPLAAVASAGINAIWKEE